MQKEEMGQVPIFIQMFRKAEPFYQGRCAGAEPYRKLEEEYAYWDIELQKGCDEKQREAKEQLVLLRASMEVFRDYHYFVQGIDAMLTWLGGRIPELQAYMEGETEKEPLS